MFSVPCLAFSADPVTLTRTGICQEEFSSKAIQAFSITTRHHPPLPDLRRIQPRHRKLFPELSIPRAPPQRRQTGTTDGSVPGAVPALNRTRPGTVSYGASSILPYTLHLGFIFATPPMPRLIMQDITEPFFLTLSTHLFLYIYIHTHAYDAHSNHLPTLSGMSNFPIIDCSVQSTASRSLSLCLCWSTKAAKSTEGCSVQTSGCFGSVQLL